MAKRKFNYPARQCHVTYTADTTRYPWAEMNVGDWFIVPITRVKRNSLYNAAKWQESRHRGQSFQLETQADNGVYKVTRLA